GAARRGQSAAQSATGTTRAGPQRLCALVQPTCPPAGLARVSLDHRWARARRGAGHSGAHARRSRVGQAHDVPRAFAAHLAADGRISPRRSVAARRGRGIRRGPRCAVRDYYDLRPAARDVPQQPGVREARLPRGTRHGALRRVRVHGGAIPARRTLRGIERVGVGVDAAQCRDRAAGRCRADSAYECGDVPARLHECRRRDRRIRRIDVSAGSSCHRRIGGLSAVRRCPGVRRGGALPLSAGLGRRATGVRNRVIDRLNGLTRIAMATFPVPATPSPRRVTHLSDHLRILEAESIQIIREVVAEFERPVMLYSIGKDSSVLLRLGQKAFYPAPIPFPLLHIDTTYKFREMITFRDWYAAEAGATLIVHTNADAIAAGTQPFAVGTQTCCGLLKTRALL